MITGEAGAGLKDFGEQIAEHFAGGQIAIAKFTTPKKFLQTLAEQLGCPIEIELDNGKTKGMTVEELKEEILLNISPNTLFILPEARRISAGIRYWLEDIMYEGARVCALSIINPKAPRKDIFLEMIEIELPLPSDREIRKIMQEEAEFHNLKLTKSEFADLQTMVGRSPLMARKIIRNWALGIKKETAKHSQYVNVTPLWFAFLAGFAAMKFVGMGVGDKSLQVFGGLAFMAFMSLKQLGQIKGSYRGLGQCFAIGFYLGAFNFPALFL